MSLLDIRGLTLSTGGQTLVSRRLPHHLARPNGLA